MPQIIVNQNFSNYRIDKYLSVNLSIPREQIKKLIGKEIFSLNHKIIDKASAKLKEGDAIQYKEEDIVLKKISQDFDESTPAPKIDILHDNEDFLVLNKPPNLLTHPKININEVSVITFLLHHYPDIKTIGEDRLRPGIVHRLDQDTSGILVVTKNNTSFDTFKSLFKNRKIHKTYVAFVYGKLKTSKGEIDEPIARSPKNINKYFSIKNKNDLKKSTYKEAKTYYKRLKYSSNYSFVGLNPVTGRTHQIRVHLTSLGHPIVGDKVYKFKNLKTPSYVKRQMLHAEKISFVYNGKNYEFQAPLPNDMIKFMNNNFPTTYNSAKLHSRYKPSSHSI